MAEEPDKPEEQQEKPKKKLPVKAILIVLGITLAELGGFAAIYFLSPTKDAAAETLVELPDDTVDTSVERLILRVRAVNVKTGKRMFYDMEVAVVCDKDDAELLEKIQKKREMYLRDQFRTIISAAHPKYFEEEKLQTLKRQIGAVLTEVFGKDRIKKVLIPDCTPYTSDF